MSDNWFELTPWVTVAGNGSTMQVAQERPGWKRVGTEADAIWRIEVKERVGSPNVWVQTAYIDDDGAFQDVSRLSVIGSSLFVVRLATAVTPALGWLRWRVTGSAGSWSTTFRITGILKRP